MLSLPWKAARSALQTLAMPLVMDTPMETAIYHISNMPILGSVGYLATIWALYKLMAPRPAFSIPKAVLIFYNAAQVAINAYVAYMIAAPLGGQVWGIGNKDSPAVRYGVFLHYLCKYMDFIDTLIIVLRKKNEQLSFLHLWHHATIGLVWGWVVNTWPTAEEGGSAAYAYGAWINSCIHVIMYFYYGVTALGVKVPTPIKKSVTTAQLTQFASCITHAIAALFFDSTPVFYNAVQVMYHIGMLKLFLPLLLGKKPAGGKDKAQPWKEVQRTPATKDTVKSD